MKSHKELARTEESYDADSTVSLLPKVQGQPLNGLVVRNTYNLTPSSFDIDYLQFVVRASIGIAVIISTTMPK